MTDDTDIVARLTAASASPLDIEAAVVINQLRSEIGKLKTERGILSDDIARRITERQAVIRAEREACAQIADHALKEGVDFSAFDDGFSEGCKHIAAAIRSRSGA